MWGSGASLLSLSHYLIAIRWRLLGVLLGEAGDRGGPPPETAGWKTVRGKTHRHSNEELATDHHGASPLSPVCNAGGFSDAKFVIHINIL